MRPRFAQRLLDPAGPRGERVVVGTYLLRARGRHWIGGLSPDHVLNDLTCDGTDRTELCDQLRGCREGIAAITVDLPGAIAACGSCRAGSGHLVTVEGNCHVSAPNRHLLFDGDSEAHPNAADLGGGSRIIELGISRRAVRVVELVQDRAGVVLKTEALIDERPGRHPA